MEPLENIIKTYLGIIRETEIKLGKVKQHIYRISTFRVILFLAGIAGIIYYWNSGWLIVAGISAITFLPLLILVKYHNRPYYKKEYLEKKIEINHQELKALDYDISAFDCGKEFIDPSHFYTYDLDVFGEYSLFQYINRTSTVLGKKRLAAWFNEHLEKKAEILRRQEAIRELTSELSFRQRFRTLGLLHKGKAADETELETWAKSPSLFRKKRLLRMLPYLVGGTNFICLGLMIAGIISSSLWGVIWTCFVIGSFIFTGKITKMQTIYGKKLQILSTYAGLLQLTEELPVQCNVLKSIKEEISGSKRKASQSIQQLSKLMNDLDQRNNIFIYVILNGLFFWELRQIMRIEAWKEKIASDFPCWLNAIGEVDALNSLANFAYNHPDYTYPNFTDHPFILTAESLGHPLMHRDRCIQNDIYMEKRPFFIIITGANMAGKSTYLRTVGINYLLACVGTPVWARSMTLYPARLVTSLRTSDSLTDNESYFFAELKRLKLIIDKLNAGEELFIILDEILKGTNSADKQKGSLALIKQFMLLHANGIIATHDLMLGTLVNLFPKDIRNHCFEAEIANNELTFSYQIKDGVAQNMNACFLMKKMGIAIIDD